MARALQTLRRMELTGRRRTILLTLLGTMAWAGYLMLFMWSWRSAGNGASIVLGFGAVACAARAMWRPTVQRALDSMWLLFALLPVVVIDRALHSMFYTPDYWWYEIADDAVTACVAVVAVSGFVLLYAIKRLAFLEQVTRERLCDVT
jgi:hypothetical protein